MIFIKNQFLFFLFFGDLYLLTKKLLKDLILFFKNLKMVKKEEAKNARTTVIKTIIAPIAAPGPAYEWAALGNNKDKKSNVKYFLNFEFFTFI